MRDEVEKKGTKWVYLKEVVRDRVKWTVKCKEVYLSNLTQQKEIS